MTDDELKNNTQDEPETSSLPDGSGINGDLQKQSADGTIHESIPTQSGQDETSPEGGDSADADPFAELRRNLKEFAATEEEKKQKSIVGRITSRLKRPKTAPIKPRTSEIKPVADEAAELEEHVTDSPSDEQIASMMEPVEASETEPEEEEIATLSPEQDVEDFILSLEPSDSSLAITQDESPIEPDEDDFEEPSRETSILKPGLENDEDGKRDEALREVALEDYGKEGENEVAQQQTLVQRFSAIRKGLKPVERMLFFGVAGFLIIACVVVLGTLMYQGSSAGRQATPVPTLDLPFPIRLKLAGSGYFDLHRGKVENGKWQLKSQDDGVGEWLEGTEVCKWVALPWNIQLEAVIRSLTQKDTIELRMSNADVLIYKVYSIKNVPVDQIESLERNGACLLVILANEDADTRWVVTAIP